MQQLVSPFELRARSRSTRARIESNCVFLPHHHRILPGSRRPPFLFLLVVAVVCINHLIQRQCNKNGGSGGIAVPNRHKSG